MGAVWYTADPHFGHKFLAMDIRGFGSIAEHDEAIIENWNNTVAVNDVVYILGDLTLRKPLDIKPVIDRLNGAIHLIFGNHDAGFPGHRQGYKYVSQYLSVDGLNLDSAQAFLRKRLDGVNFLLSHFPYSGDHGDDRYTQYRLRNQGLPIVHGHTHSKEVISYDLLTPQIHVGMDAWKLRPVNQEDVLDLIKKELRL